MLVTWGATVGGASNLCTEIILVSRSLLSASVAIAFSIGTRADTESDRCCGKKVGSRTLNTSVLHVLGGLARNFLHR